MLAACLSSGMAVANAAAATGEFAPRPLADVLNRAQPAGVGCRPGDGMVGVPTKSGSADGWAPYSDWRFGRRHREPHLRKASPTSPTRPGCDAGDEARAAAERASVLIAGPLGLCYLPAFVCLGIVPVIAGLATDVLRMGVL